MLATGYTVAPEHSGQELVPGEGHAHAYVNGEKIARRYGPWMHIGRLPEGAVDVEITLNSNDHRTLAVDGAPEAAEITLEN